MNSSGAKHPLGLRAEEGDISVGIANDHTYGQVFENRSQDIGFSRVHNIQRSMITVVLQIIHINFPNRLCAADFLLFGPELYRYVVGLVANPRSACARIVFWPLHRKANWMEQESILTVVFPFEFTT
jgi:hypothetical protein